MHVAWVIWLFVEYVSHERGVECFGNLTHAFIIV